MDYRFGAMVLPRSLDQATPEQRLATFVKASGYSAKDVALVNQVHGIEVQDIRQSGKDDLAVGSADALMTKSRGMALVIRTADCVPITCIDREQQVVAVAHAGWKGIISGVIGQVVEQMYAKYQTMASDLHVSIGPAICGQHYDVSTVPDDRVARFETQFSPNDMVVLRSEGVDDKVSLDLPQACQLQCLRAGILANNIQRSKICTYENTAWPSHRREGNARSSHIWTWVCLD